MPFIQGKTPLTPAAGTVVWFVTVLALLLPPKVPDAGAVHADQVTQAVSLIEGQNYAAALEILHTLEKSFSDPSQLSGLIAVAYLGQGHQLLAEREFPAARDAFRSGRNYNELDLRLWHGEAITLYLQGQYSEAVTLLDQAIGIEPRNSALYLLLGKAYYADGRLAEAYDALQESLALGGDEDVAGFLDKVRREWQVEQEMREEYRGHFQLSYADGADASAMAADILDALEGAYVELGSILAYYPDVRVPVLLYSQRDYADVTRSPDWAGAVYDGKIRLSLSGTHGVDKRLVAILYHEYMHVLVHFMAGRNVPAWLNEGLAELSGRSIHPAPMADLHEAVASGQLIAWDLLDRPFATLAVERVPFAYEQSYSLVSFMVDRYGWHNMAELLQRLGKQQEWSLAVADVYGEFGLDWPAIQDEWQAGLR